jgi:hypothetical protein
MQEIILYVFSVNSGIDMHNFVYNTARISSCGVIFYFY